MAEKLQRTHASHETESASPQVEAQTAAPEFANEFVNEALLEPRARTLLSLQNIIGNQAVQRALAATRTASRSDNDLAQRIQVASSGGGTLDASTRERLQASLGVDLSSVRVHLDDEADRLAASVEAIAFTTGNDVFFRKGMYQPETATGLRLLAHEVTHTIQQSTGPVEGTLTLGDVSISEPGDTFEREAEAIADHVSVGQAAHVQTSSTPIVARSPSDSSSSGDDTNWLAGAQSLVRGLLGATASGQGNAPLSSGGVPNPVAQSENSIDDLLTFLRNQAGFHAGAEMPPTFNSRSASPFGTRAHQKATEVLGDMQTVWPESQRIISEPVIVNGEIVHTGSGPAGAPKGSHVPDYLVTTDVPHGSVVGQQASDIGERIGDLKYGGGEIAQKYAAHGLPLETQRGQTQAPPETPPPGGYEDFRLGPEFDRPGLPPEAPSTAPSLEEAIESGRKGGGSGGTLGKVLGGANYGLQFLGNLMQGQDVGESAAGAAAGGYVGNRVSGGGWDTAINLGNAGLQLLGAPKEVTDFTQIAADATPSGFATSLASNAGRGAWNLGKGLVTGDWSSMEKQGQDVLQGKAGAPLQGYGMIADVLSGGDTNWMIGDKAKRGDYGVLPAMGNYIGDEWFEMNKKYGGFGGTMKEFGSEMGSFLWEGATGKGGVKSGVNWAGNKLSDAGSAISSAASGAWDYLTDW